MPPTVKARRNDRHNPVSQGSRKQQGAPVDQDEKNRAELEAFLSDKAIGREIPWTARDNLSRRIQCIVVTDDAENVNIYQGFKHKFFPGSQNPFIEISEPSTLEGSSNLIPIGAEHMKIMNKNVDETIKETTVERKTDQALDLTIFNAELTRIGGPTLTDGQLSIVNAAISGSIQIYNLGLEVTAEPLTIISQSFGTLAPHSPLRQLLSDLNEKRMRITVLRQFHKRVRDVGDKVFRHRLQSGFTYGLYPYFRLWDEVLVVDSDGKEQTKERVDCFVDGDLPIPKLPFMKTPSDNSHATDEDGEIIEELERYNSTSPRRWFTSLKDWRDLTTILAIKEHYHQRAILYRIFAKDKRHSMRVQPMPNSDGWYLYVTLGDLGDLRLPMIPDETQFHVKLLIDVGMSGNATVEQNEGETEFSAHVVSIRARESAFVLEYVPKGQQNWAVDAEFEVVLDMAANIEPLKRQVAAMRKIADFGECWLRSLILGHNFDGDKPPAVESFAERLERVDDVTDDTKASVICILQGSNLNGPQSKARDSVMYSKSGGAMTIGPPGTGKSQCIAHTCRFLLGQSAAILAGAPSRAATKAMARKIKGQFLKFPDATISLTIAPTRNESESMALEYLNQREKSTKWSHVDDTCLLENQLFVKTMASIETYWEPFTADEKAIKAKWVADYEAMQKGELLGVKRWSTWWKLVWDRRGHILSTSDCIISTCNNMAALIDKYGCFGNRLQSDGLVIVDEAGFSQDYDLSVPLSFNAKFTWLVGDYHQFRPTSAAHGCIEFSKQGMISLLERSALTQDPALFSMLSITYRMPAKLADFPGLASGYKGLLTQDSTVHDNDSVWLDYTSWFDNSPFPAVRRERPERKWNQKAYKEIFYRLEKSARRLFFNVRGRSGTPAGSTSTVNYANINAIYIFLEDMLKTKPNLKSHITILVPFAAQLVEMSNFFEQSAFKSLKLHTIDSFQGSEDDIIILCLSQANRDDPAFIGFLNNWNRLNVAITRAKQALAIFGNLDAWCQRLRSLKANSETFAMMIMDVRDRGDVIDMDLYRPANHFLPAIGEDGQVECPPSKPRQILGSEATAAIRDLNAPEKFGEEEWRILVKLEKARQEAEEDKEKARQVDLYTSPVEDLILGWAGII